MLFDLVFASAAAAAGAVVIATLAFALAHTARGRVAAAAALGAWFAAVLIVGATGSLAAPGLGLAVLAPAVLLSFSLLRGGRRAAAGSEPPTSVLIGAHTVRVLGVAFVLLYAAHRLPAPFAPSAGWGDIAIGLTAPVAAWLVRRPGGRGLTLLWNLLGCLDLISAIGLGAMSAPGPARLFLEPPGSGIMVTLPWILIPAFLVPSLFALHVAIFGRLLRRADADRGLSSSYPGGINSPKLGQTR